MVINAGWLVKMSVLQLSVLAEVHVVWLDQIRVDTMQQEPRRQIKDRAVKQHFVRHCERMLMFL